MVRWGWLARRGKTAGRNFAPGPIPLLHENHCYAIRAARNGQDVFGSLDGGVLVRGVCTPHATIIGFCGGSFCEVSGVTQIGTGGTTTLSDRQEKGGKKCPRKSLIVPSRM